MSQTSESSRIRLGWREWVALPELGLAHIKAKVDTGARTSALHAFSHETFRERGVLMVRFRIHPVQRRVDIEQECVAEVIDKRTVSDSGGHREKRLVINTPVQLGGRCWDIEMTLTNRDNMQFRMLLGRTAISGNYLVDPGRSYLVGHKPEHHED
ncbi:MAG: RimK/LysX family protein [Gammaproteobacteria bacterium]|nr:RimK/LysX family protein [Gammaproteobacteria bacterium]MCW8841548.1 RimK/LysX family protein [Gammaproteobacteria bacterium]MCW8927861.1 RimK/LysX family protein [Gammaproteobacteria bacterium]MCW8958732.1 RimK/LysX family protein [Gammaproteobacteria bacterium]MCW8973266.1 RimK/LysX family protein [Gammaproteobacteria bacterium]